MRWELLKGIWEAGMIRLGDFTLTSGKKSPYYIDLRTLPSHVRLFAMAIEEIELMVRENETERIGVSSVELSGIPLGATLAFKMGKPFVYVRKEMKMHGTGGLVEGDTSGADRFVVVDDVLTTGGSILHVATALRGEGVEVRSAYVLIDRLQGGADLLGRSGIAVRTTSDVRAAMDELKNRGLMPAEQHAIVIDYLRSESASV